MEKAKLIKLEFEKMLKMYQRYYNGEFGGDDIEYITLSKIGIYNHMAKQFNTLESIDTQIIVFSEGYYCKNNKVATMVLLFQIESAINQLEQIIKNN